MAYDKGDLGTKKKTSTPSVPVYPGPVSRTTDSYNDYLSEYVPTIEPREVIGGTSTLRTPTWSAPKAPSASTGRGVDTGLDYSVPAPPTRSGEPRPAVSRDDIAAWEASEALADSTSMRAWDSGESMRAATDDERSRFFIPDAPVTPSVATKTPSVGERPWFWEIVDQPVWQFKGVSPTQAGAVKTKNWTPEGWTVPGNPLSGFVNVPTVKKEYRVDIPLVMTGAEGGPADSGTGFRGVYQSPPQSGGGYRAQTPASTGGRQTSSYTGSAPQEAPEVESALGELNWWGPDALLPMIRDWGNWMRELLQTNKQHVIPTFGVVPEIDPENPITTAETRISGLQTDRSFMDNLRKRLGLEFTDEEDDTTKWQKTIDSLLDIKSNDITTQQMLNSLRYDPTSGWYTADIGMIQNPYYL